MTLPLIGLGLVWLLQGINLLVLSARHDRGRFFYGANGVAPPAAAGGRPGRAHMSPAAMIVA
jgi:hypothetical protein